MIKSERLASLGIMGDQLRASLKKTKHHGIIVPSGLRGALNLTLIMPTGASLSVSQCNFFKSGNTDISQSAKYEQKKKIYIYTQKYIFLLLKQTSYNYIYKFSFAAGNKQNSVWFQNKQKIKGSIKEGIQIHSVVNLYQRKNIYYIYNMHHLKLLKFKKKKFSSYMNVIKTRIFRTRTLKKYNISYYIYRVFSLYG